MRTLTSPVTTQAAAEQSGWVEIYDIYLKSAITTPFGSTSIIRITSAGIDVTFFKPTELPEAEDDQGDAATYTAWNIGRKTIRSSSKFANDKLAIAASNVTGEWATMLSAVDWYGVPVVIRKVPTTNTGATANDCVVLFSGRIDSAKVTLERVEFVASNDLGSLQTQIPNETMHTGCRFKWADDQCTKLRFLAANYKAKTAGAGGSTTRIISSDFTEDTGAKGYVGQAVTADASTDKITLTAHGLEDGVRVRFSAAAMPGGLTAGVFYWVVNSATNDFKVAATEDGSAIDITSNGTTVLLDSTAPYGTDQVNAATITASSEQTGYEGSKVKSSAGATDHWRFSNTPTNPTPSIDIYSPYVQIDLGSATLIKRVEVVNSSADVVDYAAKRIYTLYYSSDASTWTQMPTSSEIPGTETPFPFAAPNITARYWRVQVKKKDGTPFLYGVLGKLYFYSAFSGGSDLINPLANGAFTASDEKTGNEALYVQSGQSGVWKVNAPAPDEFGVSDWGNNYQGYWQIPDAQAGLANVALKPYISFDFGSAKALKLWRVRPLADVERKDIPRVLQFYSSEFSNFSVATHEMDFEMPPTPGLWSDVIIHGATSRRYWRICVRSTWAEAINYVMLCKVRAYTVNRNWWASGRVRFDDATATAALRGVSRRVIGSFTGAADVAALPAAPANGDTFVIERGCPRTFNACCERLNLENFGGFTTMPEQTVQR